MGRWGGLVIAALPLLIGAAYGAPLSQPCSEPPLPRVSSIPSPCHNERLPGVRSDGEEETQIAQTNPETTNQADPDGGAGSRTPRPACHGRGHAGPLGWARWPPRRDTLEQGSGPDVRGVRVARPHGAGRARQEGPRTLPRLCRRLRPARRTHQEPQGGPGSLREWGRRRRAGVGSGSIPRRCRALLGPDRDPSLHACPRGAGEHPLDDGASGRSNRSPPGHAAPQSQRQPGGTRHSGRVATGRRTGRGTGPALRAV